MQPARIQNLIAAAVLAAGILAPAVTEARAAVYVNLAPPAPIVEAVPAPRVGYVWAPGYYSWNGHRHVWRHGYWVRERAGRHWVAHRWERRGNGWYFHDGYWARG